MMSLKREKEETYKPGDPSLSIPFQKAPLTLFGMASPIFDFHADILLP